MASTPASNVREVMAAINRAWRENRPSEMFPYLHPDVTVVLPGFRGAVRGRDLVMSSFEDFCASGRILDYAESDEKVDVVGNVAVVHYRFEMLFERASHRERSTGRDIWAFERVGGMWVAVWRTMVGSQEEHLAET